MNASTEEARESRFRILGMVGYAFSLAVSATLVRLVVVVASEALFPSAESWTGAGILWAFSIPGIVALSACSCLVYPAYRRAANPTATGLIYLGNLACVAVGGPLLTYGFLALVVGLSR